MKYNTLRQYYDYHPHSGFIVDRRQSRKIGSPQVLGQQVQLTFKIQKQFPHLGYQPRFIDLNQGLQRKRYSDLLWLPDLIHFLYFKSRPVGPLIYRGDKRHEYERWMADAEAKYHAHTRNTTYDALADLHNHMPPISNEEHLRIDNLMWFKPVHPYIYWHWQAQRWTLQFRHRGRRLSKSYPFDQYIYAVSDLMTILAKIRGIDHDDYDDDPDLRTLSARLLPFYPRSQSARAAALDVRRPETLVEALWRAADELHLQRFLDHDDPLASLQEFDAIEHHAVQRRSFELERSADSDGVPLDDL